MSAALTITDLPPSMVPAIADLAPASWRTRLDEIVLAHLGKPWFRARIGVLDGRVAAVGHVIRHRRVGWIGNVIVPEPLRSRGFGTAMTRDLIDLLESAGATSTHLCATSLGFPVYRKLGFRTIGEYVFLEAGPRVPESDAAAIRRLREGDVAAALRVDAAATGEERAEFLEAFLPTGWVRCGPRGDVEGLFLPALGSGFVAAESADAGGDLLRFKHALHGGAAVAPAANEAALACLRDLGFRETSRAPRMARGDDLAWAPSMVFARGTGYCG